MFLPIGDDVDNRSLSVVGILLVSICILVFLVEFKKPTGEIRTPAEAQEFVETWGLAPKDLTEGRYHGVLSYIFLHGDLMHIVGNLVVLWAFANSLENHLGIVRFLVLFLIWGAAGGLAHAAMHWGHPMPLIGASGAIAGMIGAYWMAFGGLTKIRTLYWFFGFRTLMIPTPLFVFLWVMSQLMGATDSELEAGGTAWYCHLGGFLAGAIIMLPLRNRTAKAMRLDEQGQVRFENRPTEMIEEHHELPPLEVCPFCHAPLRGLEDNVASFIKCSNRSCQRLVFLDPELMATL